MSQNNFVCNLKEISIEVNISDEVLYNIKDSDCYEIDKNLNLFKYFVTINNVKVKTKIIGKHIPNNKCIEEIHVIFNHRNNRVLKYRSVKLFMKFFFDLFNPSKLFNYYYFITCYKIFGINVFAAIDLCCEIFKRTNPNDYYYDKYLEKCFELLLSANEHLNEYDRLNITSIDLLTILRNNRNIISKSIGIFCKVFDKRK